MQKKVNVCTVPFSLGRFLQEQQVSNYCHFFNTYFYKKLSDAVTNKVINGCLVHCVLFE